MTVEMHSFTLIFFISLYLDEHISDNEEMNADMIDALKKDFETMLPNFEEHLRKKYPPFVGRKNE